MSFSPKVKKLLTVPFIKFEEGKQVCFVINKECKDAKRPSTDGDIPTEASVTLLPTRQLARTWLPDQIMIILDAHYPNAGYVGKGFSIIKTVAKNEVGKKYNVYEVAEIECDKGSKGANE